MIPAHETNHDLPVEPADLQRALSRALSRSISSIEPIPLGESTRKTPWRVDCTTEKGRESFVVRLGDSCNLREVLALQAMAGHPIPTPLLLHWDPKSRDLGMALFVTTLISGVPLLPAMKAQHRWAEDLYLDTACSLQAIRLEDLPPKTGAALARGETADSVLASAYEMFSEHDELIEAAYAQLRATQPRLPKPRFSNGDLWPENILISGRHLTGVIDWQHAGFSDPLFEFLLPFFLVPELRHRGIEERFCQRNELDIEVLRWYRGLEIFDSLRWVVKTGKPYGMHTEQSLRQDLAAWLG